MGWVKLEQYLRGDLILYLLVLLDVMHFLFASISPFPKLPTFRNSLPYHCQCLWKTVHPVRPACTSSSFPTNHECKANSLRPFITFWQSFKCYCSSCLYTLSWKITLLPFLTRWLLVKTIILFIRCKYIPFFKKVILGSVVISLFMRKQAFDKFMFLTCWANVKVIKF